jgi:hypothetical protein
VFASGSLGICGVFQNPTYVLSDGEIAISSDVRAGSGNLNNLDKWKFCLNAA